MHRKIPGSPLDLAAGRCPTIAFYHDLHSHSVDASDDAGGTVEGYLKWIVARRKKGFQIDGFVLTEHRGFDPAVDYTELAARYDLTVLRGAELETTVGHVLVYGVTPALVQEFDFRNVRIPYEDLFQAAKLHGGVAVGAHAGRRFIGLEEHVRERGVSLEHVNAVEALNGGSNDDENGRATRFAEAHGLNSVGGSDAHYVSAIGRYLTAFERPINSIEALVEELRYGQYHAVRVEDTVGRVVGAGGEDGA